VKALDQTGRSA